MFECASYTPMMTKTVARTDLEGSCPVCGAKVPRTTARWNDGVREVYRCPEHGAIEYGPRRLSLLESSAPVSVVPETPMVWEV